MIFVMATRPVTSGQDIEMSGMLEESSTKEASNWISQAKLEQSEYWTEWKVQKPLHLHVTETPGGATP